MSVIKTLNDKILVVLTLLISLSLVGFSNNQQKPKKHQKNKNESVAKVIANYGKYNFGFKTLDGKNIRLSDYSGKVVLVNIWAPWCAPCKIETQGFVKLYEKYHAKGFEILGIAVQTNESDVRSFIEKFKVRWQIGIKDEITKSYATYGIPDSYLFKPDGSLIKEFMGYTSEEALEPLLKENLNIPK